MKNDIENKLNNAQKVVGLKQVLRAISSCETRCVVLAEDADDFVKQKVIDASAVNGVDVLKTPSKDELGKVCGISVAAAVVALANQKQK